MSGAALKPAAPGEPPLDLGRADAWLFTDLHLRADVPEEVAAFTRSLEQAPAGLDAVVVMGDLFDAYMGPELWREPGYAPLAAALEQLARRGPRLILLRGNRDVLLERADGAALGATVTDSVLLRTADGTILITHGDEFCLRDRPYQRLRWWLRRRWLRALARRLPYSWRRRAAGRLRNMSRTAVARKPLDTLALVEEAVSAAMARHGARAALIGHLHVAEQRSLPDGHLRILPAWAPGTPPLRLTGKAQTLEFSGFMSAAGAVRPHPVVTLDGLAGSGKSTLARRLAGRLGWAYLDSGAWYRALAWATLERRGDPARESEVLATLSQIELHCHADGTVLLDGRALRGELRTPAIDAAVVEVADHTAVRAALNERMRRLRSHAGVRGVVADGRDAGTVIFPEADIKVYVDVSLDERARRRSEQTRSAGARADLGEVRRLLAQRDARDVARGSSAPRLAPGGHWLDNNRISEEEAVQHLLDWVAPLLHPAAPAAGARAAAQTGHPAGPSSNL